MGRRLLAQGFSLGWSSAYTLRYSARLNVKSFTLSCSNCVGRPPCHEWTGLHYDARKTVLAVDRGPFMGRRLLAQGLQPWVVTGLHVATFSSSQCNFPHSAPAIDGISDRIVTNMPISAKNPQLQRLLLELTPNVIEHNASWGQANQGRS